MLNRSGSKCYPVARGNRIRAEGEGEGEGEGEREGEGEKKGKGQRRLYVLSEGRGKVELH